MPSRKPEPSVVKEFSARPASDVNPFLDSIYVQKKPASCTIVIFGATGDLTKRKLLPAIYNLASDGLLPASFNIIGFARRRWSDNEFRENVKPSVATHSRDAEFNQDLWKKIASDMEYVASEFENPEGYSLLLEKLKRVFRKRPEKPNNVLFYLATPPAYYHQIIDGLGRLGLSGEEGGWRRIIVEKPFGQDLESAKLLNSRLYKYFHEEQIFRIDHYLGKETVQNILFLRFANGIFEPIWNRRYVDHIQITVAETLGVEGRAGYYEKAGVLRDMIQNHLLQLVSLTAMEPPATFEPEAIRDEKVKVLKAIRPIPADRIAEFTVRAQYEAGVSNSKEVIGYRDEQGVAKDSTTETYAAVKLYLDNWRWSGVPIYLRSGKRLPKRVSEIAIVFKQAPLSLFGSQLDVNPNSLILNIQPHQGISLNFTSKVPGPGVVARPVAMEFRYGTSFGEAGADAYERLLLDSLVGESTLFIRRDEVEAAWRFVDGIAAAWKEQNLPSLPQYKSGLWGPLEADRFIENDGRRWRRP